MGFIMVRPKAQDIILHGLVAFREKLNGDREISGKFELAELITKGGMTSSINLETEWQSELQAIATVVRTLALSKQGDNLAILALLRQLEQLHREIRDGLFQASLPDNRQALYALLKDIESNGGWPYIQRMQLQAVLAQLVAIPDPDDRTNHNLESDD